MSCIGGQTSKDCHPTGSLFEPATASRSESAAQTIAFQESTPNVTVENAVSVLLHDKGKPLGLAFLSREENRAPPPSCKRRSFVNHCTARSPPAKRAGPCPVSCSNPVYASHLLAMSLHFSLPKIRTFRFSLHTSRLSLHGEVTMVALKFAMSSHFPLPKIFSPSGFVPPIFQMARAARRVIENPRQKIKRFLYCV